MDGAPALEARGIERAFGGRPVLRGIDLRLDAGETVALLGPNGAGKTTLLRILALLLRPQSGTVRVRGLDGQRAREKALRMIGYLGHESACYADLTARENLAFYAALYGVEPPARIDEVLTWMGLGDGPRRPLRECSRGVVQRVALARALLHAPAVLLLDEPFTGLDPAAAESLEERLRVLRSEGCAVLASIHDVGRAATIATRALVLHAGRLAWSSDGAPPDAGGLAEAYRHATAGRR